MVTEGHRPGEDIDEPDRDLYFAVVRLLLPRQGGLADKGLDFDEIDVTGPPEHRRAMIERSGRSSVPQIFIDGAPIGGSDELARLYASGALDRLRDTENSSAA